MTSSRGSIHERLSAAKHSQVDAVLDIVVVNWNSGDLLRRCVDVLGSGTELCPCRLLVVDNASTDGSAELGGAAQIVSNRDNVGFAAACNQGAALGAAPYLLFLNPDAVAGWNTIQDALDCFQLAPDIAVVGVQLLDDRGMVHRSCARQPTVATMICHAVGMDRVWPSLGYVMGEWDHSSDRFVDHVIGAFYLMKRSVFEELGGFDERFFLYLEDVDLSRRVLESGRRIFFRAGSPARHFGGGSSRRIPVTRLYLSVRARLQFARKHFGLTGFAAVALMSLTVEPLVRALTCAARGAPGDVMVVARAYGNLWRWVLS